MHSCRLFGSFLKQPVWITWPIREENEMSVDFVYFLSLMTLSKFFNELNILLWSSYWVNNLDRSLLAVQQQIKRFPPYFLANRILRRWFVQNAAMLWILSILSPRDLTSSQPVSVKLLSTSKKKVSNIEPNVRGKHLTPSIIISCAQKRTFPLSPLIFWAILKTVSALTDS